MKIVVLDAYASCPGDISWDDWNSIGELAIYDRTRPEEVVERIGDAEVVLTNKVVIDSALMDRCPTMKYVGVMATGYNVVDTVAAEERGVVVTNIPAYSTMSVAQMVFAHVLNLTTHVAAHSKAVGQGRWQRCQDFCFWDTPLLELDGRTFAVVGLGNTGMAAVRIAQAMGMRIMAMSSKSETELAKLGIAKAENYEQLFRDADVLSLHCPLTPDTHHLVNAERLALMKPTAIVVNTGRGPLVDEEALAAALYSGQIYGAGVDVLTQEPPRDGSPLIGAPNCTVTPHIAWATEAARHRLMNIARENIIAYKEGRKLNRITLR